MTDHQQGSPPTNGAVFENGEEQAWATHEAAASGDQLLGEDSIKSNGQDTIASDDSEQQDNLFRDVDGNDSTQKEGSPHAPKDMTEPVAIIGFSLRFPEDATSAQGFWNMLYQGRSAMTEIPKDRFNIKAFYHPDSSRISSVSPDLRVCTYRFDGDSWAKASS